jgi:hypothetical protein
VDKLESNPGGSLSEIGLNPTDTYCPLTVMLSPSGLINWQPARESNFMNSKSRS